MKIILIYGPKKNLDDKTKKTKRRPKIASAIRSTEAVERA